MNIKRATFIGFMTYVATFMLGVLFAYVVGIDMASHVTPLEAWLIGMLLGMVLMVLATWWYFRPAELKPSVLQGVEFGIVTVLVAFVCDGAMILPYVLATGDFTEPLEYYTHPLFWSTVVLMVVMGGITAKFLDRQ